MSVIGSGDNWIVRCDGALAVASKSKTGTLLVSVSQNFAISAKRGHTPFFPPPGNRGHTPFFSKNVACQATHPLKNTAILQP